MRELGMEGNKLSQASELLQSLQKEYDSLILKERELVSVKNQSVDQYAERREISKRAHEIGKLIVYQTNIVQALRGSGRLTVIPDNYGASFVCPDFRKIPAEYYAFEEETILLNPKPDYIPDLGKEELRSKGYVFDSVRIEEDSYVIALNGFEYKKPPNKYAVNPEPQKEINNTFAILTLEQLVLTSQYYFVYAKAVEIKRAKEANERSREYFINKPEASRLWYYDQKNFYFSLPNKIQKQYTQEQWNALALTEKEALYVPVKRYSVKRIESKLESNKMYASLHKMYEAFVDSSATSPKEGFANEKVWQYWEVFREMMKWKINDLQVRSESDSEIRKIALETSFGDSGINDQLRDTLGIFVKRQNGSDINIEDINQISEKWISLNNTFGVLNKTAYDFGLKISHTGKTFVYASKASGMFIPSRRAIAASNKFGDSMFGYILAHEVGHFIDYTVGKFNSRSHASDNYESKAGILANTLKQNLNKKTDSKYTNATSECFARAMEQYFAISTTGDKAFHEYSVGKLYFEADDYVNKEVFYDKLKPAVEAFLKESSWIFGDITTAENIEKDEPEPATDNRISQEVEGGEGENDSLDEATRYIRDGIAKSKEEQQGRLSGEEERRLEKVLALRYAKENGIWITDFYSFGLHMEGGNENTLAYNYAEGMVYKSNNLSNYEYSILKMLEGIKGHNEIFDCDKYEFVGFTGIENSNGSVYVEPVFKQKYMHESKQASQPEIDAFMQGLGFSKTGDHSYENEKYAVSDLRPRNVLKDENGNICVIDDIVKMKEQPVIMEDSKQSLIEKIEYWKEEYNKRDSKLSYSELSKLTDPLEDKLNRIFLKENTKWEMKEAKEDENGNMTTVYVYVPEAMQGQDKRIYKINANKYDSGLAQASDIQGQIAHEKETLASNFYDELPEVRKINEAYLEMLELKAENPYITFVDRERKVESTVQGFDYNNPVSLSEVNLISFNEDPRRKDLIFEWRGAAYKYTYTATGSHGGAHIYKYESLEDYNNRLSRTGIKEEGIYNTYNSDLTTKEGSFLEYSIMKWGWNNVKEASTPYTKSKIDGYTIEREGVEGGKTRVVVKKGNDIKGFVYPTVLYPEFISDEKAIEEFELHNKRLDEAKESFLSNNFPSYSDAIKMPKGGAQAMDKFNFLAQAAEIIGGNNGIRPEAVYNWANIYNVDLGAIGHIMSDINNRDTVFSDIVNTNTYDKVKKLVEAKKGAKVEPTPEPPLESDADYFKEMLAAIKISEKFADAEEKEYFRELKEAIKISLKYA